MFKLLTKHLNVCILTTCTNLIRIISYICSQFNTTIFKFLLQILMAYLICIRKIHMFTSENEDHQTTNTLDDEHLQCFKSKGLHFIHLNARSLLPKISELRLLAAKTKAAVIAISESWLDQTVGDGEIYIDGYCLERKDRNRNGGGVCLYILTIN